MLVITVTAGWHTFVESSRPPSPTSSTTASTCRSAKCMSAIAVVSSKNVGRCDGSPLARGRVVHLLDDGPHAIDQRDQLVGRARLAVDGEPLLEPLQVRRAVDAHVVPGGVQNRGDQRRGGAFALGAGDVDDRHARRRDCPAD